MSSASCTPNGRLPDANKVQDHLRDIFYRQALDVLHREQP